jgi:outer membrane protein OmpA-like peptidoglycan-associated protein
MKFMKKTFILLCLAVFSIAVQAQVQDAPNNEENLKWRWFKTNGFWDNWEVSVAVGPTWFVKYGNHIDPSFGEQTELSFDVSVVKWVNPIIGARLRFQDARGTSIANNYSQHDGELVNFHYTYLHYDQMWNLTNWFVGYRQDRVYNAVLTTGFGWVHNYTWNHNNEFAFNFGLQNRFRLSDRWNIFLGFDVMLTKSDFDVMSDSPRFLGDRYATAFNLTAGATYKFPISTWEGSPICPDLDPYNDRIASLESDLYNAMKALDEVNKVATQSQDAQEKCAKELEDALTKLKECESRPAAPATAAEIQNTDISFTIFFDKGDVLTADAQSTINQIANIIKKNDKNTTYLIVGYADKSTGTYQGNMNISKKRAERVRNALIKQGIKGTQLRVDWRGDTEQPYSVESGILNRVVVISMIK